MSARKQAAFTLIEMLVVLLVSGMVVSTLFEALSFVSRTQTAADAQIKASQGDVLFRFWYQNLINGLQPEAPLTPDAFSGEPHLLSGLSTAVPGMAPGVVVPFKLELRYDNASELTSLWAKTPKGQTQLGSWSGGGARFSYIDTLGEAHDAWPPPLGLAAALPNAVRITLPADDGKFDIYAKVSGPPTPHRAFKPPSI